MATLSVLRHSEARQGISTSSIEIELEMHNLTENSALHPTNTNLQRIVLLNSKFKHVFLSYLFVDVLVFLTLFQNQKNKYLMIYLHINFLIKYLMYKKIEVDSLFKTHFEAKLNSALSRS